MRVSVVSDVMALFDDQCKQIRIRFAVREEGSFDVQRRQHLQQFLHNCSIFQIIESQSYIRLIGFDIVHPSGCARIKFFLIFVVHFVFSIFAGDPQKLTDCGKSVAGILKSG